jgi:hypothetical protein
MVQEERVECVKRVNTNEVCDPGIVSTSTAPILMRALSFARPDRGGVEPREWSEVESDCSFLRSSF